MRKFAPQLNIPYEIADDVGHWLDWTLDVSKIRLSEDQCIALSELRSKLASMSGPENEELWSLEALRTDRHWEEVRTLASRVVQCVDEIMKSDM